MYIFIYQMEVAVKRPLHLWHMFKEPAVLDILGLVWPAVA